MSDRDRHRILHSVGRASGLAGGVTATALWLTLLASPAGNLVMLLMAALAALMVVAAWSSRAVPLLVLAAISFVPVGLYLLGTPSIYAGIGLADLLCAAGGGLMLAARRAAPQETTA